MALTFNSLRISQPDAEGIIRGRVSLENGWSVSIVSGPQGSGVAGLVTAGLRPTWEVGVFKPSGGLIEDVLDYQTEWQVESILRLVAML